MRLRGQNGELIRGVWTIWAKILLRVEPSKQNKEWAKPLMFCAWNEEDGSCCRHIYKVDKTACVLDTGTTRPRMPV